MYANTKQSPLAKQDFNPPQYTYDLATQTTPINGIVKPSKPAFNGVQS